jgi:hypothetical protein
MPLPTNLFSSRQCDRDAFARVDAAFDCTLLRPQETPLGAETAILARGLQPRVRLQTIGLTKPRSTRFVKETSVSLHAARLAASPWSACPAASPRAVRDEPSG